MSDLINSASLRLREIIMDALGVLVAEQEIPAVPLPSFNIEIPADKSHGDFAANTAMVCAKALKMPPRKIAELICDKLSLEGTIFEKAEVAGPGFLNFFLSRKWFSDVVKNVLDEGGDYGKTQLGKGKKVLVEFVSANPTGPMHIGNARGGAIGEVLYVDANYGKGGEKLGGPSHPVRFWDDPRNAAKEGAPNPDVDWSMWLGPARMRPYSDQLAPRGVNRFYPMFWRFDDDIGSGYNGDWGAHHLDIAQWGLDADKSGPYRIVPSSEPHSTNLFHGGRRQFGMKMLFKKPYGDVELYHGPFGVWGTVFYGTDGVVAVNRGKIAVWKGTGPVKPTAEIRKQLENVSFMKDRLVAASVGKDYGTDATVKKDDRLASTLSLLEKTFSAEIAKAKLYVSPNQVQNFCECVETRKPTVSPAETGGRSCILCLLCNLSYQYDTGFDWDPEKMEFANGTGKGIPLARPGDCNGWKITV